MTQELKRKYKMARKAGYRAIEAMRVARIVIRFRELESDELVQIAVVTDEDDYFDCYGMPEGYIDQFGRRVSADQEEKELLDSIERLGNWIVRSEFRLSENQRWRTIDSVGMCVGYEHPDSWLENWYVPDLMQAAINAIDHARQEAVDAI